MSDDNFLGRWSRLKHEAAQQRKAETAPDGETANERSSETPTNDVAPAAPKSETGEAPFDPASLPPIESIDALSDIRAFLAPGVPTALTHAALRRAWVADPAIRDFVGLSENSWDFTTPGSIPGFGDIGGSEELRRLVAHFTEGGEPSAPAEAGRPAAESSEVTEIARVEPATLTSDPAGGDEQPQRDPDSSVSSHDDDAAVQHEASKIDVSDVAPRRGHGGALPQ